MNRDQWTVLLGTMAISGAFAGAVLFFQAQAASRAELPVLNKSDPAPVVQQTNQTPPKFHFPT